jgi:hypothetical protein
MMWVQLGLVLLACYGWLDNIRRAERAERQVKVWKDIVAGYENQASDWEKVADNWRELLINWPQEYGHASVPQVLHRLDTLRAELVAGRRQA